jgi:hypothetical protein
MKHLKDRWIVGGFASLVMIGIGVDFVHGLTRTPKAAAGPATPAQQDMQRLFRETGGDWDRLSPEQKDELYKKAVRREDEMPKKPLPPLDPKVAAKMKEIWTRTNGGMNGLTTEEKALIEPYMKRGYNPPGVKLRPPSPGLIGAGGKDND